MSFKPKTVRRLTLLAVVVALVVGAAFSLFFVRRWQINRQTALHRRDGLAALAARDYRRSLSELARYLQRGGRNDPEVLLAFAKARFAQEEPDFSHLRNGIQALHEYLAARPDDREQRMVLVKAANQAGMYVDARDAAEGMRPADIRACGPAHIDILREEAIALCAAKLDGERLDSVVTRLLELAPLDTQGHLIRLEVWGRTGRAEEARALAQSLLEAHPKSVVARLVSAAAVLAEPNPDVVSVARVRFATALGLDPATGEVSEQLEYPDAAFVSRVVDILDRIGSFDLSLSVLRRWNVQCPGTPTDRLQLGLVRTLARRLWQQGEHRACVAILTDQPAASIDSEVLAFRGLSSQRLGRGSEARDLIEVLRGRKDDFRAAAWAGALPLADPSRPAGPLADVESLTALVKANNRLEPILLVMLGECYAALSREEEARSVWREAGQSPVCSSWPFPRLRCAETLLAEGRADEALVEANAALQIGHRNPTVNAIWFEVRATQIQKGRSVQDAKEVLSLLDLALSQIELAPRTPEQRQLWERLQPPRLVLLSRSGQPAKAAEIGWRILDAAEPPSASTLHKLAAVSLAENLGIHERCQSLAAALGGASPGVSLARAIELADAGDSQQGLVLLRDASAKGGLDARIRLAEYLSYINDPGAVKAWVSLGDEHPTDLTIQSACLWSPAIASDREFVERTIARYQKLSGRAAGEEDAAVHTARAHMLLIGTPSAKDRDAAVAKLALAVAAQPARVEPRLLLARTLVMSDAKRGIKADEERALAILEEAAVSGPLPPPIALELASLLAKRDQRFRATEMLTALGRDSSASVGIRHAACKRLMALGNEAAPVARQLLSDLVAEASGGGREPSLALLIDLATASAAVGESDVASATFRRVVSHPRVRTGDLLTAARFFQRCKDDAAVSQTLQRLAALDTSPGMRSVVEAHLAEDRGDRDTAVKDFERAIALEPASPEAWRAYVSTLVARGEAGAAIEVATRGLKALPADPTLRVLLEQARLSATVPGDNVDLAPLLAAMSADTSFKEAAEAIRAVEDARARGELDSPDRMADLAERFREAPALQAFLAQRMHAFDPGRAVRVIERAQLHAPHHPLICRTAVSIFKASGEWQRVIAAAQAWKHSEAGPEPDLAVAEARAELHDYRGALAAIAPLVQVAVEKPSAPPSLDVLRAHASILLRSGRETDARMFLSPLLTSSPRVRTAVWLRCAGDDVQSANDGLQWITLLRQSVGNLSIDEQVAAADALCRLATRFPAESTALLSEARTIVEPLTRDAATAAAWESLAIICMRLGESSAAIDAYRKALAKEPDRETSLNNLAMMLADTDPGAALPLAIKLVERSPDVNSLMTLGLVQEAVGRSSRASALPETGFKDAAATYARITLLRPRDVRAWSRLAQAAYDAEDYERSAAAWKTVAEMPGLTPEAMAVARNNQASAILRHNGSAAQARPILMQAMAAADLAAFQDTLGWVELADGKREAALNVFRACIERGAGLSSRVGLAAALAAGSPEEQREAAVTASGIQARGLDPYLARKVRQLLTDLGNTEAVAPVR